MASPPSGPKRSKRLSPKDTKRIFGNVLKSPKSKKPKKK